jgi:hypothetical protein
MVESYTLKHVSRIRILALQKRTPETNIHVQLAFLDIIMEKPEIGDSWKVAVHGGYTQHVSNHTGTINCCEERLQKRNSVASGGSHPARRKLLSTSSNVSRAARRILTFSPSTPSTPKVSRRCRLAPSPHTPSAEPTFATVQDHNNASRQRSIRICVARNAIDTSPTPRLDSRKGRSAASLRSEAKATDASWRMWALRDLGKWSR